MARLWAAELPTSGALNGKFSGKMSLNLNVPFLYGLSDCRIG